MSFSRVVPDGIDLEILLETLRHLSWGAAEILRAYARGKQPPYGFQLALTVEEGGEGPVSAADLAVNHWLISGLAAAFPDANWEVLSEETSKDNSVINDLHNAEWLWILDPLDGTKDFLQGSENYAVHLALLNGNNPVLGVVLIPEREELWFGVDGKGTWFEKRDGVKHSVSLSDRKDISELILVASKNHRDEILDNLIKQINFAATKEVGSIGCKVATILRGSSDVYISLSGKTAPKDWDMAAPHIILEAAGGAFSHADGSQLIYKKSDNCQRGCLVASHGINHLSICEKVIKILSSLDEKYKSKSIN